MTTIKSELELSKEKNMKEYLLKNKELNKIIKKLPDNNYHCTISFNYIEKYLDDLNRDAKYYGGKFEDCPDFQRGHVWTQDQKIAYIENICKGLIDRPNLMLNASWWESDKEINNDMKNIVVIDGLQRLTAIREFMKGEFKIFNKFLVNDLDHSSFSMKRRVFNIYVYTIKNKKDLLNFYLDLNSGGTIHSNEELNKVKQMIDNLI